MVAVTRTGKLVARKTRLGRDDAGASGTHELFVGPASDFGRPQSDCCFGPFIGRAMESAVCGFLDTTVDAAAQFEQVRVGGKRMWLAYVCFCCTLF